MKPIYLFYHITDFMDYEHIAHEQISKLEYSGLLDAASHLYINYHSFDSGDYSSIKTRLLPYGNVTWVHGSAHIKDYEHSTAVLIQEIAKNSIDSNCLYFHQKGVSHKNLPSYIPCSHWRWYLDYWNIENWVDCIKLLEQGYDGVGCNLSLDSIPHYSGTTRWLSSRYIKRMPQLVLPSSIEYSKQLIGYDYAYPKEFSYRYEVEFQIGVSAMSLDAQLVTLNQLKNYDGYKDIIHRKYYALN